MHVALVSCQVLPEPDPDQAPLERALRAAGCQAETVAWNDPRVDWPSFDVAVLRSAWDYHHEPVAFLAWVEQVSEVTKLWNPATVVKLNLHKRYLLDLASRGVRTVPTCLIERGASTEEMLQQIEQTGWGDIVIKPAISVGSFLTKRLSSHRPHQAVDHTRAILDRGDALLQPFMKSVETVGERSVIWIDGEVTHVVRKSPRFHNDVESVHLDAAISEVEQEITHASLGAFSPGLLYGRVDLVQDEEGAPCVAEVELIEPSLFLTHKPEALGRLVQAVCSKANLSRNR